MRLELGMFRISVVDLAIDGCDRALGTGSIGSVGAMGSSLARTVSSWHNSNRDRPYLIT
jgi:hypothetical protein